MVFNTYHHNRTCLDEKIEIDEKKFQNVFSLPFSLRVTLKLSLRSRFSAKKHFFVSCRKFDFNLEKLSNHYSQLKKQVKVDPETRSYDFLTKTREKNPMSPNIPDLGPTLEYAMITLQQKIHEVENVKNTSDFKRMKCNKLKRRRQFFLTIVVSSFTCPSSLC